jgi:uncharacterized protein (TIGR02453 family)
MLHPQTLEFLSALKKNNSKPWFDENRSLYEVARADFQGMLKNLISGLSRFDETIKGLQVKDCVFRINRDIRFSHDKRPYKNNFGAAFSEGGKKSSAPGYYLHIEPGSSFLAGGVWQPPPDQLQAIRQEIDYNLSEFREILEAKPFRKFYRELDREDMVKTAPKGYSKENPALEYLKYKSYTVTHPLEDSLLTSADFQKYVLSAYEVMMPFNRFLKRATD